MDFWCAGVSRNFLGFWECWGVWMGRTRERRELGGKEWGMESGEGERRKRRKKDLQREPPAKEIHPHQSNPTLTNQVYLPQTSHPKNLFLRCTHCIPAEPTPFQSHVSPGEQHHAPLRPPSFESVLPNSQTRLGVEPPVRLLVISCRDRGETGSRSYARRSWTVPVRKMAWR